MKRFIVLSFLFLGWGFYELSGGADFVPEVRDGSTQVAEAATTAPDTDEATLVTRASTRTSELAAPTVLTTSLGGGNRTDDGLIVQASLSDDVPEADIVVEEEAFVFESLVEGAPSVADILPETEVTISRPEAAPTLTQEPAVSGDIRRVAGSRVNMRSGPGTNFGVVVTLSQGADVEVFEVNSDGWARLRNVATGQEGWMAERLLSDG